MTEDVESSRSCGDIKKNSRTKENKLNLNTETLSHDFGTKCLITYQIE